MPFDTSNRRLIFIRIAEMQTATRAQFSNDVHGVSIWAYERLKRLTECLTESLTESLTECLTKYLTERLIECLTKCLTLVRCIAGLVRANEAPGDLAREITPVIARVQQSIWPAGRRFERWTSLEGISFAFQERNSSVGVMHASSPNAHS